VRAIDSNLKRWREANKLAKSKVRELVDEYEILGISEAYPPPGAGIFVRSASRRMGDS
jgi:hypothetical protein